MLVVQAAPGQMAENELCEDIRYSTPKKSLMRTMYVVLREVRPTLRKTAVMAITGHYDLAPME